MHYHVTLEQGGHTLRVAFMDHTGKLAGRQIRTDTHIPYAYAPAYAQVPLEAWENPVLLTTQRGFNPRWLYGRRAADTITTLALVTQTLGTDATLDRGGNVAWERGTPGNAGLTARMLLHWARTHPDAIWHGD